MPLCMCSLFDILSLYMDLFSLTNRTKLWILKVSSQFLHSIVNSDNSIVRLCGKILLMGSKSNVGENIKTISNEFNCLSEEVCMPPGRFNIKIMNTLEAMYSEEDVVVVDNILDPYILKTKTVLNLVKKKLIVCLPSYVLVRKNVNIK